MSAGSVCRHLKIVGRVDISRFFHVVSRRPAIVAAQPFRAVYQPFVPAFSFGGSQRSAGGKSVRYPVGRHYQVYTRFQCAQKLTARVIERGSGLCSGHGPPRGRAVTHVEAGGRGRRGGEEANDERTCSILNIIRERRSI
jgi:hypothetical protein